MAQKRKNDGELPESSSCKKQKKMKGKANFIISAAAAIFFPLFSFIINNDFSLKVGKKTPPSIDQLEVRNSVNSFLCILIFNSIRNLLVNTRFVSRP